MNVAYSVIFVTINLEQNGLRRNPAEELAECGAGRRINLACAEPMAVAAEDRCHECIAADSRLRDVDYV